MMQSTVKVFAAALLKLQNEGYIERLVWVPPDEVCGERVTAVRLGKVFLTRQGVEHVERQANIEASEKASAKILHLAKQVGQFGMVILKEAILTQI